MPDPAGHRCGLLAAPLLALWLLTTPAQAALHCLSAPWTATVTEDQRAIRALLDSLAPAFARHPSLAEGMERLRATFAIEADASAVSLHVAWDLKQLGDPAPWQALAAWPLQADVAARCAQMMDRTGDGTAATAAAFRQWYDGHDRVERYYVASCSDYLDRQERTRALPATGTLDLGHFTALCRLPDDTPYPCEEPETLPRR